ncbi:MAG: alpha/beta fold hydrolase [Flavobacteriales bacterium]
MSSRVTYNLLTFNKFSLSYKRLGCGEKILIAFHGFDQNASIWRNFENSLGKKYTIYSFNHFFHGSGHYPADRIDHNTMTKKELFELIEYFLEEKKIHRFSIAGYSLGGRISLTLIEYFANRLDEAWLFAPDGLTQNFWYKFASSTKTGRELYKQIMRNPNIFFSLVRGVKKVRFISQKTGDFVINQMATYEKRLLVYNTWMAYRHIMPNLREVARLIDSHAVDTHLFLGKYDFIFPPRMAKKIPAKKNLKVHIVESGHNLFTASIEKVIKQIIGYS